jgi:hypothetical protein
MTPNEGRTMRARHLARILPTALAVASVAAGGVAFAGSGSPGNSGSSKPGKGCGDKNHVHYKESECKQAPR